ncbi:hypothetical protein BH20ACT11_BH20ACT11_03000 [soil metagenome]
MSEDSSVNKKITKNITAGLDLGDRYTYLCLLDTDNGEVLEEGKVRTTSEGFARRSDSAEPLKHTARIFRGGGGDYPRCRR